ncbi:hypothetical protein ACFU98_13105 [Streptomyces sp. NPDC057575]|uniref:hypothetical protein n=1 Tax=unclassified Streptomyces TaxID=2593676 RepID=UPI0036C89854
MRLVIDGVSHDLPPTTLHNTTLAATGTAGQARVTMAGTYSECSVAFPSPYVPGHGRVSVWLTGVTPKKGNLWLKLFDGDSEEWGTCRVQSPGVLPLAVYYDNGTGVLSDEATADVARVAADEARIEFTVPGFFTAEVAVRLRAGRLELRPTAIRNLWPPSRAGRTAGSFPNSPGTRRIWRGTGPTRSTPTCGSPPHPPSSPPPAPPGRH